MKLATQLNEEVKKLNESSDLTNKVFIQFRNSTMKNEKEPSWLKARYTLNSKGDGWFRNNDKFTNSEGNGIAIQKIDRVLSDYVEYHNGGVDKPAKAYKASVVYEKGDAAGENLKLERAAIWLVMDYGVDLSDVEAYIQKHKQEWKP